MRAHHVVADEFFCCIPVALRNRHRKSLLIHSRAAEPDILGMMRVPKNVSEKHFTRIEGGGWIARDCSGDESRDFGRRRFARASCTFTNFRRALPDVTRRA